MKKRTARPCWTKTDQRKEQALRRAGLRAGLDAALRYLESKRAERFAALRPRPAVPWTRNEAGYRWEAGRRVAR